MWPVTSWATGIEDGGCYSQPKMVAPGGPTKDKMAAPTSGRDREDKMVDREDTVTITWRTNEYMQQADR